MSLLRSGKQERKSVIRHGTGHAVKPLTITKKPSPTYQDNHKDSARNPDNSRNGCRIFPYAADRFLKGISWFTSYFGCNYGNGSGKEIRKEAGIFKKTEGSMTVEAAIVLPMLLFFFLNLGCAIEMIRLHGNLQLALWQIGRELSVYGYALDSGEMPEEEQTKDEWWKGLGGMGVASVYVKNRLVSLTGRKYLNQSPLTRGADGLTLLESEVFGPEDRMDIVVTYSVSPWSRLIGFPSFRMANRYYTHIWNGYELRGGAGETEGTQTVYVTATGTVYHPYRDCTHLQLSVHPIPAEEIEAARNQYGGRYRPCEKCGGSPEGNMLYITEEGDCFHSSRECTGLKRTLYTMGLEEAEDRGLRLCGRCGQRP